MPGAWPLPSDLQYIATEREPKFMESSRSCNSPRLRGKTFARSAVGFRDQFTFLETPYTVLNAYRQLPGSSRDPFHTSRIANNVSRRTLSPLLLEFDNCRGNEASIPLSAQDACDSSLHALLVPDICVTPETRVIGSGYHNFWVATEVIARWHVPGQDEVDAPESSGLRSSHFPHSTDFGESYRSL